jgi:hypothetical protein
MITCNLKREKENSRTIKIEDVNAKLKENKF